MKKKKVIVIGLDGASHRVVKELSEKGELPNFQKMIKEGIFCNLHSTYPPVTAPANATLITGKNPGNHGVFDFIAGKPGEEVRFQNFSDIHGNSLWRILSSEGKKCIVLNVPMTYPPEKINGILASGFEAPSVEKAFNPARIYNELKEQGIDYTIEEIGKLKGNERKIAEHYMKTFESRKKAANYLMKNHKWDFFMVYFRGTDTLAHFFWKEFDKTHPLHDEKKLKELGNPLLEYYKKVDAYLGEVLSVKKENTTLMVISDHGFMPLYGVINVNMLFLDCGLLKLKNSIKTKLKWLFFRIGLTPERLYSVIEALKLDRIVSKIPLEKKENVIDKMVSFNDVDWKKTKAYSRGHNGQIYINEKNPAKRKKIIKKVKEQLNKLTCPYTGNKIVKRIVEKEKVIKGRFFDKAPDLYVEMKNYIFFPLFASSTRLFSKQMEGHTGNHDREGIFLALGKNITKGKKIKASIEDFAPTVLYEFGLPIPNSMDGKVMSIFAGKVKVKRKETREREKKKKGFTKEQARELERKLKGLGYLGG